MNEHKLSEDCSEETSDFLKFIKALDNLIQSNNVIIEGYCRLKSSATVKSAKAVHKVTIGKRSWEHDSIYLFPDLLIRQLKKQNTQEAHPLVFFKKDKLRKMLIRGGLITRRVDGHTENQVQYKGVLVEAWPIDISIFNETTLNI